MEIIKMTKTVIHAIASKDRNMFMTDSDQRELISWFWKNKPELIREIVCENCIEHIGMEEEKDYCENKKENGR